MFSSLCALSQECKNLKVRINAGVALRAPRSRAQYGAHYAHVWRGVMLAMENAANVDDFTEYKHKDNLIEQVIYYVFLFHTSSVKTIKKSPKYKIKIPSKCLVNRYV